MKQTVTLSGESLDSLYVLADNNFDVIAQEEGGALVFPTGEQAELWRQNLVSPDGMRVFEVVPEKFKAFLIALKHSGCRYLSWMMVLPEGDSYVAKGQRNDIDDILPLIQEHAGCEGQWRLYGN